jgi:uncharacterized protein (DUF2249 family)/hemerythrin superfamily protein
MASAQPVVVCHSLPPAARQPTVLATFDALKALETFLLVSDHAQVPALRLLQEERPGLFEWSPLEEGPERWSTEITRRPGGAPLREVTEALSWDHDRLDDLARAAFAALAAGDHATARETFARFARGLRRHIGFEEELLFPEFERLSGLSPDVGPTSVLRAEHREIEALLAEIERALADGSIPVAPLKAELDRVLGFHNVKEEQVLYPGADRLMSAEDRDELVRQIQGWSPK